VDEDCDTRSKAVSQKQQNKPEIEKKKIAEDEATKKNMITLPSGCQAHDRPEPALREVPERWTGSSGPFDLTFGLAGLVTFPSSRF